MPNNVICNIGAIDDKTGDLLEIKNVLISNRFYVESTENEINNMLIIKLLQKYPDADLGIELATVIDVSSDVAMAKEVMES